MSTFKEAISMRDGQYPIMYTGQYAYMAKVCLLKRKETAKEIAEF